MLKRSRNAGSAPIRDRKTPQSDTRRQTSGNKLSESSSKLRCSGRHPPCARFAALKFGFHHFIRIPKILLILNSVKHKQFI